jgi:hypothetical protein
MSETFFDQYEHYNFTEDNKMLSGNSGRLRSKKVKSHSFVPLLINSIISL